MQTFFANPIAGPFVLGISSGAKLVVSLVMVFLLGRGIVMGSGGMILAAFAGSMISMGFILLISHKAVSYTHLDVYKRQYANRTINGYRYYFDENGAMATGWVSVGNRETNDATGISTLKYFGGADEGQMARGWRYLYDDPEDTDDEDFSFGPATSSDASHGGWAHDYEGGDGAWYYFDNNGTPAYLSTAAQSLSGATTRVDGHRYFFDAVSYTHLGMSMGSAAAFMITGPATKITNLGALKIVLGMRRFLLYIGYVMLFSFVTGLLVNFVL